jgi:hypothetical protein
MRGYTRPRCCTLCGEPLEDWKAPLQPGVYIACYPCARLYVVLEDGELALVLLSLQAPEIRRVFDDLLQVWWAQQARRDPDNAAARAAA